VKNDAICSEECTIRCNCAWWVALLIVCNDFVQYGAYIGWSTVIACLGTVILVNNYLQIAVDVMIDVSCAFLDPRCKDGVCVLVPRGARYD